MKSAFRVFAAIAVGVVLLLVAVCVAEFARRNGRGDEANAATKQQAADDSRGASGQTNGEAFRVEGDSSDGVCRGARQKVVSPQEQFDQLVGDVLEHAVDELDATIKAQKAADDKEAQECEEHRQRACRSREERYFVFNKKESR